MISYVANLIHSVFKPAVAALAISLGIAIISFDSSNGAQSTVSLGALGCDGLLKMACVVVDGLR